MVKSCPGSCLPRLNSESGPPYLEVRERPRKTQTSPPLRIGRWQVYQPRELIYEARLGWRYCRPRFTLCFLFITHPFLRSWILHPHMPLNPNKDSVALGLLRALNYSKQNGSRSTTKKLRSQPRSPCL